MSYWSLESRIPAHLWSPLFGSEGLMNNWIQYSIDDDVFFVPATAPANLSAISNVLEAVLDDKDIQESLNRAQTTAYELQRYAMYFLPCPLWDEKEKNNQRSRGYHHLQDTKTSSSKISLYRGVTKCNEQRFEAFVWDNTNSDGRGRTVYIGGYSGETEAAKAHDVVSIKLYGESTFTNFPVRCYSNQIHEMQKMSKKEFILSVRRMGKGFYGKDCPYRGVYRVMEGRRWEAWLGHEDNGMPRVFLGRYYCAEDAARAYDITLIKFKGMEAITNFDLSSYEVMSIMKTTKPPTVKNLPTMKEILFQRGSISEASSSSFLRQQLINLSSSFHGYQNPSLIQSNPYSFGRSGVGTNYDYSVGKYGSMFRNKGANVEQPLTQQLTNSSSSSFHGLPNPNLIQSNPYSIGGLAGTGTGSGVGTNDNSSVGSNYGAMFPNKGAANVEQPLTQPLSNSSSSFHGYQNPYLIQSNYPYSIGGLTGTGTGSGVGTNENSVSNNGAMFPNQGTNVEQSLLLGTGKDFQAPESQQNQLNVNMNNDQFHHNLLNNQSLPQSSSLPLAHNGNQNLDLQNHLSSPHLPSDFGSQTLGGDMEALSNAVNVKYSSMSHMVNKSPAGEANGGSSLGLHSEGIYQVQPPNQEFEATQQVPILDNQSSEPHKYNPNNLNQNPNHNSNSSFFTSFMNLCSETNTGSLSQVTKSLDDSDLIQYVNSSDHSFQKPCSETNTAGSQGDLITKSQYVNNSSDIFQNPSSETNTGSQCVLMTESQVDLDSNQYLNSSNDSSQNPYSETNTGLQSLMTENQNDFDMIRKYLSGSYIMEGETDWFGEFEKSWEAMEVDNGLWY